MSHFGLVCCLWLVKGGVELWLNAFLSFDPAGQGEPRLASPLIGVTGCCERPFPEGLWLRL